MSAQPNATPATGTQGNLLAPIDAETWLLNRLQQHGVDVYIDGQFDTLRDRLAHVITANRYESVVVGRNPNTGKAERYQELFERMYGVKLETVAKARKRGEAKAVAT